MLLNAVIICCIVVVNTEQPLNSYSLTGDNSGYDYGNAVAGNGYLGSRDGYQNDGSFYNAVDISNKLSSHVNGGHPLESVNHGSVGGDTGNGYGHQYLANDHANEYAGYSKAYENTGGDSYAYATRATPVQYGAYSASDSSGEATFNAYTGGVLAHKDADFGQYGQRIPFAGYSKPSAMENYADGTGDGDMQEYRASLGAPNYAESDRLYPRSPGGPHGEYSFGKQKDGGKYGNDVHSIPMRYTRGYATSRDAPPYLTGSPGPSARPSKVLYETDGIHFPGKPYKYGHKHLSRYAPSSGANHLSRERDGYYLLYGKNNGKVIVMKDGRPSYVGHSMYPDEPPYTSGGYRSKSGAYIGAIYSTSPNFDGYSGPGGNYDDSPILFRRYRPNGGHMIMQKTVYP